MGVERIAGQVCVGQVVLEAFGGRERFHLPIHLEDFGGGAAILRHQHGAAARRFAAGPRRVELECPMRHVHLVAVRKAVERALEAALAHVAPGADDVGPDVDL